MVVGLLDQSRLKEFLRGPLFEVEVHDRDRVVCKYEEGSSLFGEERDDGLLGVPNKGLRLFDFHALNLLSCIYLRILELHSALMLVVR